MNNSNIPENIILCKKEDNISLFKNQNPYKIYEKPTKLLNGKIFNPPFFRLLIINDTIETSPNQIMELYNNVLMNGTFVIPEKYGNLFKNLNNPKKKFKNYVLIHKKNNMIYIYKKYRRMVDVIICGVQKASTTSALINMKKHPDISAHGEELHFIDIYWTKSDKYFKEKHDYSKEIILAKNPDLLYLTNTHWMIQNVNPFMKLIIILRNPIDRAYSSWQMIKNNNWTNLTFEEAIEDELKYRIGENRTFYTAVYHYLQRGLYYEQIVNLLKWFPRQNIKILIMEHMTCMEETYNELFEFINLKKIKLNCTKERVNKYDSKIDKKLYNNLKKFFIEDTKKLEDFLGYKTKWFN